MAWLCYATGHDEGMTGQSPHAEMYAIVVIIVLINYPDENYAVVDGTAEEELEVEFFFEEVGAALGIAKIFGDIAACFDLESDRAALERGVETKDALAVGVVEPLGDAH